MIARAIRALSLVAYIISSAAGYMASASGAAPDAAGPEELDGLEEYVRYAQTQDYNKRDPFDAGLRMRIMKHAHPDTGLYREFMAAELYWLQNMTRPEEVRKWWTADKGIVFLTGNKYFRFAVHLIRVLRYQGCWLPVEVYHEGDDDLDPNKQRLLNSMWGVRAINLRGVFGVNPIRGWDMKPFVILASRFKKVMLLDADVVFLENPESLFSDKEFIDTGALYFPDRNHEAHARPFEFLDKIFPMPVPRVTLNNPFALKRSRFWVESALLVIDKQRHLWGLLMCCIFNLPYQAERGSFKDWIYGEKEAFWMGMDLMDEPYAFMPFNPGSIGVRREEIRQRDYAGICGKLLHFDRNGQPIWFNDSIVQDKKRMFPLDHTVSEFEVYAVEGKWLPGFCLNTPLQPLSPDHLRKIRDIQRLYLPQPEQQFSEYVNRTQAARGDNAFLRLRGRLF